MEQLWEERTGVLSTQVIQEFYVNVRRKAQRPVDPPAARKLVEDYLRWEVVVNDGQTILGALDLVSRCSLSFWDALIVEAAKKADVAVLCSEVLAHGQSYDGVRIVNPFG